MISRLFAAALCFTLHELRANDGEANAIMIMNASADFFMLRYSYIFRASFVASAPSASHCKRYSMAFLPLNKIFEIRTQ
jgi:hypothetical protein